MAQTRARAAGFGFHASVGIVTRTEHIILLGVATLVLGSGSGGYMLLGILTFIMRTTRITVVHRRAFGYKVSTNEHPIPCITVLGSIADPVGKGI